MMLYGYLAAAILVLLAIGGAGFKGFQMGETSIRAEWAEATAKARDEAETERQRLSEEARKSAKGLQTALSKERTLKNDLSNALQAHIRAIPATPVGCPKPELSPGLLDDWRRGNAGPDGQTGGIVPGVGGKPAGPAKP